MDTKLYLTIAGVVAILYALGFLLLPVQVSLFFSDFAEPRAVLDLRFCGAAVLAWGLIVWFARDFRDWHAVRSVLIASVVGLAVNVIINVWGTVQGWLNSNAWGTTVVLLLLLIGEFINSWPARERWRERRAAGPTRCIYRGTGPSTLTHNGV